MSGGPPTALGRLKAARTQPDIYRAEIDIQRLATPAEIVELFEQRQSFDESVAAWIAKTRDLVFLHHPEPRLFDHRLLDGNISHFAGPPGRKTLIVGFCGVADMLCLPIPTFLQYFDPVRFDVVVLRDPTRRGFAAGLSGHSTSFAELIERLARDLAFASFESIRCIGTSGGGAASLAAGQLLAAPTGCFCGRPPTASSVYGRTAFAEALEATIRGPGSKDRLVALFGAGNPKDEKNAHALAALTDLTLVPIEGLADHNVIGPLHQRGDLAAVFARAGLL
jgi:hypothetical protein